MEQKFTTVIKPKRGLFELNIKEVFKYKDLILLFTKRNITSVYKQTVLGPAWVIIQPLLTTVVFTIVFGNIAGLDTNGIPPFLFYLCGSVAWSYFSTCFTGTANTFVSNAAIFGKVYFPRIVTPISVVLTNLISFAIQFTFFVGFLIFYIISPTAKVAPNYAFMLLLPVILLHMALLGLGFGVIVSSVTTKYRDLSMLVSFGVQLWMYATPIAYSLAEVPEKWQNIYMLNPVTPVIEAFRYAFLGAGTFSIKYYIISWASTLVVLLVGILLFNRVEKTFMDTV
ncbi:MAG: ABC transporter permease [Clostridiales bacterium]|nr:ABC transporter permease [Clostridiales bacterium]